MNDKQQAAEIRRLEDVNRELLGALKALVDEHSAPKYAALTSRIAMWQRAKEAIRKAEGE